MTIVAKLILVTDEELFYHARFERVNDVKKVVNEVNGKITRAQQNGEFLLTRCGQLLNPRHVKRIEFLQEGQADE